MFTEAGKLGLHPVTWIMIGAAAAHLAGDLVVILARLGGGIDLTELLALTFSTLSNSALFVAAAAVVEFLFRIWIELRLQRPTGPPQSSNPSPLERSEPG
jgi:hypothetical protein